MGRNYVDARGLVGLLEGFVWARDVVVEAVVVALLLAMVVKAYEKSGSVSPSDLRTMRG